MRSFVAPCAVGLVALMGAGACLAEVRLPAVLGRGMVLQQQAEVPIWGWGAPGEAVTVTPRWAGGAAATATTDGGGRWKAMIKTPAGGAAAYAIEVKGTNTVTIEDVLVGEVWLCSGQSNMEWAVAQSDNAQAEIAAAEFPQIRLFMVDNQVSLHPRTDCPGAWQACTPKSVANFSAAGYFFGRELHKKLGVPVGLISADWGGTRVEAWMSAEALAAYPEVAGELAANKAAMDPNERLGSVAKLQEAWWNGLDEKSKAPAGWSAIGFDDSAWKPMTLPATMGGDGMDQFDGVVYFRREVTVPAGAAGKAAKLELGPIDDRDDAYVNGTRVGSTHADGQWNSPRSYAVPAGVLKEGKNVVAVRVLDTAGPGGINGKPEQLRLIGAGEGGPSVVELSGGWKYMKGAAKAALAAIPESPQIHANTATALYNGMIQPVQPFAIRGAIWYQGESNRGNAEAYSRMFPAMIRDWRGLFGREFAFYFVQIAPFTYGGDKGETAMLREAQTAALALPDTGMAVTMDIGNPRDIHPTNKQEVGRRLSLLALGKTYGRGGFATSGPTFKSVSYGNGRAVVSFDNVGGGLLCRGPALTQFQLAGADKKLYAGEAHIEGETVVVSSPRVATPVAVRYAFCNDCEPNFFNKDGLPAAPFRTDAWKPGEWTVASGPDAREFRDNGPGFAALFNGADLTGWVNVNCAPSTFTVGKDEGGEPIIKCTGRPTGVMRTAQMYENFVLELEWRHLSSPGNAGLFVWADALCAPGVPFTRAVEVQVMTGSEGEWFTSDGDIFPIHGAVMTPVNGRASGGDRAYPTEKRMRPSPEWNHYRVTCNNGEITLAVNGKVVTSGKNINPRKGYICLESEGGPIDFRSIRLKELPAASEQIKAEQTAWGNEDYVPMYTGVDLSGWKVTKEMEGHWKASDWVIDFDGKADHLWTQKSYRDFEMIVDWKLPEKAKGEAEVPVILPDGTQKKDEAGKPMTERIQDFGDSGIYLRGNDRSQVNIWSWPIGSGEVYGYRTNPDMPAEVRAGVTPKVKADNPPGQWNRFKITMKGERLTVILNGKMVLENARLPGVPSEGPIALQSHGDAVQFANLYIRELGK